MNKKLENIVDILVCPLSLEIMKDPVITPDGNTYEDAKIKEWLKKSNTEPQSRKPLFENNLVKNRALQEIISKIFDNKN